MTPESPGPDRPEGHRVVDHTADQILEAWGPTRAACLRQAAAGLVALFARPSPDAPARTVETTLPAGDDTVALLGLLTEILVLADAESVAPAGIEVTDHGDAVTVRLTVVDLGDVEPVGPAPKGISHSGLTLQPAGARWTARAIVDI